MDNKQETLEEVATKEGLFRASQHNFNQAEAGYNAKWFKRGALFGAKWQQEQDKKMYSEEEIRKSLLDIVLVNPAHITMLKSGYGQFPDTYELTEKGVDYIIEQFKKK